MKAKIQKWGNSYAVRIPSHIVREVGLEYNAVVEMTLEDGKLVIKPLDQAPTLAQLLAGITDDNLHRAVDTGDAVGKESW